MLRALTLNSQRDHSDLRSLNSVHLLCSVTKTNRLPGYPVRDTALLIIN